MEQQSSVDYTLYENTGLHVTAKVGLSGLATAPYDGIDEYTKFNIVRLNKGELVLVHPAFRYPIKIKFPRASFVNPQLDEEKMIQLVMVLTFSHFEIKRIVNGSPML